MQQRILITPNARRKGGTWHVSDASGYVAAYSLRGEIARIPFQGLILTMDILRALSSVALALHPVSKRAVKVHVSSTCHPAHIESISARRQRRQLLEAI